MLDSYLLHPSEIILVGDYNIWVDVQDDSKARQFLNLLSTYGMKQHVREPTYDHGHTLDLLITREHENVISNVVVQPGLSDHFAILCNITYEKPKPIRQSFSTQNLKSLDRQRFCKGLHVALSVPDLDYDVTSMCINYDYSLNALLDQLAPRKTRTIVVKPRCPLMTDDIREAKCLRRRLERRWRTTKTESDRSLFSRDK